MPYSPKIELRDPIVVATPEQIEAKRGKITKAAGRACVRAIETPGVQYAVLCKPRRWGGLATHIIETGRYFTDEEREQTGGYVLGLRTTPEDGVYYRGTLTGELAITGVEDEYAEEAVAGLVKHGAQMYSASAILQSEFLDDEARANLAEPQPSAGSI